MNRAIFFCLVVLVVFCNAAVDVKNLAGPPSDFPSMSPLPSPLQAADVQNSASFPVYLLPSPSDNTVLTAQITLTVDSDKLFQFIFYSPHNESVLLSLKNPNGSSVLLQGKSTYFPVGSMQVSGMIYSFKDPIKGQYILTVQSKPLSPSLYSLLINNVEPDAYVYLWNDDSLATHTALNTYSLLRGNKIGLVSRMFKGEFLVSQKLKGEVPTAIKATIEKAQMNVVLPNGRNLTTPMVDNGLNDDGEADDGVYGGLITANVTGQYIFSANVQGVTSEGVKYVRTTQQLVTVVEPSITLTGSATGTLDSSKTKLTIYLAASTGSIGDKFKAYAEVWGINEKGEEVAVAWIGGMTYLQSNVGMKSLSLQLDLNWVSRAEAKEPLVLKNVKIQDAKTSVPLSLFDMVPVKTDGPLAPVMSTLSLMGKDGQITNEMREGKRPERFNLNVNANSTNVTLLMVHGYCTATNPWVIYSEDWSNAQFYYNPLQNFAHDEFALDILKWADSFGPYAYVAHSQGGAAGLHLKNYYWSGLDQVQGGRILQSVGTPYQGSGGAGKAADLAKVFGVLCGANQDLTHDGAALWLSTITPENRQLVHYYTSTYIQGKFFGDYCNMATNLVLAWPNDGVAEQDFGQLPGGANEGNAQGWCHSVEMKYPAQCQNRDRNKIMNSLAARIIKNN